MKSGMNGLKLAVAICVVATTASAMAQGQGQGRRGFGGGFGRGGGLGNDPTFLLGIESVQKELVLSEDQKTKVTKVTEDNQAAMQDLFQLSPEERQTKLQERAKENKKKIAEILLGPQNERLDQIAIQFALQTGGPSAFTQGDLADKLSLTADQKEKIKTLADDLQQKTRDIFQDAQGDFQGAQEKITKLRDEQKAKAMELLTADQKTKLTALIGKEFKIDPTALFGGGRGFGRRGGQQN